MADIKLDEVLQLSKLNNFIKEKSEDEQVRKTVKIILICVGVVAIAAVAAYVVYRLLNRYDDDYDLYDDLDYYYDEDEDTPLEKAADAVKEGAEDIKEAFEEDFAE